MGAQRWRPRLPRVVLSLTGIGFSLICYAYLTVPNVRSLATANPSTTAFMQLRAQEGGSAAAAQRWVRYARISSNLKRAVLAAEDSAFWSHEGIDTAQVRAAIEESVETWTLPRGASTITQQLAKNLYLSPSRDPLRKLRELVTARRLETALPKTRILEIYLNVVEWGDGIWGAEAAARAHFGVSAGALTRQQAALLAGALINPRALDPSRPSRRLLRRQAIILGRMDRVALVGE